jgi:RING-variant domain
MTDSCRICLESEGPFIAPCHCNGTIKYVHASCLQSWRTTNVQSFYACELCHYHYSLKRSMIGTILQTWYVKSMLTALCFIVASCAIGLMYHVIAPTAFPIVSTVRTSILLEYTAYGASILGGVSAIPIVLVTSLLLLDACLTNYNLVQNILFYIKLWPYMIHTIVICALIVGVLHALYHMHRAVSYLIDQCTLEEVA